MSIAYKNLIPTMTSNTAPSGVASASSSYQGSPNYQPYKAMDGDIDKTTSAYASWVSGAVPTASTPEWIQYEFEDKAAVNGYKLMQGYNNVNVSPKSWVLKASNNGSQWDILDTQTNVTDWVLWTEKLFEIDNKKAYKMYRLEVTENNGNGYYVGLQVFELMGITPKMAIKNPITNQHYSLADNTLITLPDASDKNMILYGIEQGTEIQLDFDFNKMKFIQDKSEVLGEGMLFTHEIDIKKIKKIVDK